MIKKIFAVLFSVLIVVSCNKKNETINLNSTGQKSEQLMQDMIKDSESFHIDESKKDPGVDLDLSLMNYNMISSITFEMSIDPNKYEGKKVKITGNFSSSIYEGIRYYSVLVWDATGCCPTGLSFIPPETMKYPDDFPQNDKKITVYGLLSEMEINGYSNLVFKADKIVIEK